MSEPGRELLQRLDDAQRALLRIAGRMARARGDHAYLVGGSVRDLILQRAHDDLDIVVEGDGLAVAQDVARAVSGELTRHHAFQTATVATPQGVRVDVATARREDYPRAGQLPRVVAGTLSEDLERRDFTINTMAVSLDEDDWGRLIDPLGGRRDLERGQVRVMHSRSFADDPTRILRALRFAQRFDYRIDEATHAWLREAIEGGYLADVSGDRVRKELRLTLGESPVEGALRLHEEGVLEALQAGLRVRRAALLRLQDLIAWYARLSLPPEPRAPRWAAVLACCAERLPQQARWALVRRLRLSRGERAPLIESGAPWSSAREHLELPAGADHGIAPSVIERTLRALSVDALLVAAAVAEPGDARVKMAREYLAELRGTEPDLDGADLQQLGVEPGPAIGELLDRLRAARLDGAADDADDERRLVRAWLAEKPS